MILLAVCLVNAITVFADNPFLNSQRDSEVGQNPGKVSGLPIKSPPCRDLSGKIPPLNQAVKNQPQMPMEAPSIYPLGYTAASMLVDVKVDGNYAYAVHSYGLVVYDVSHPGNIQVVSELYFTGGFCFPEVWSPWAAVDISGDYAYVVNGCQGIPDYDNTGGLFVVDISNPLSPTVAGVFHKPTGVDWDPQYYNVVAYGHYAFCLNYVVGLDIIDASDPTNPVLVNTYSPELEYPSLGADITGSLLVFAHDHIIEILDISDPLNPVQVGISNSPDNRMYGRLAIHNGFIYACLYEWYRGIDVFDITIPESIEYVGRYDTLAFFGCIDAYDNHIVTTGYTLPDYRLENISIINISDPSNPATVAQIDDERGFLGLTVANNRAYVCGDALDIIELANPSNPVVSGRYIGGRPHNVEVTGQYAYFATYYDSLGIADISNPANPILLGFIPSAGGIYDIEIAGNMVYCGVSGHGLQIFDISEPNQPVSVSVNEEFGFSDFCISGNIAYLAAGTSGLKLVDISDPANPVTRSQLPLDPYASKVHVEFPYAYVNAYGIDSASLNIIDVSDPSNPNIVSNLKLEYYWVGELDLDFREGYIYVGGASGIIDVTDPNNPVVVESVYPPPCGEIHIAGHHLYALDNNSVNVFDISNPHAIPEPSTRQLGPWDGMCYEPRGITTVGEYILISNYDGLYVFSDNAITSPPHIDVYPSDLYFSAVATGAIPSSQSVEITNGGTGPMTWSASSNQSWLDISPSSGSGNSSTMNVTINSTSLDPDQIYTGAITITSPEADNTAEISVEYYVSGNITVEGYVTKAKVVPEPLAGATVNFHNQQSSMDYPASTDGEGYYTLTLPPGAYTASVSKTDYESVVEFDLNFQTSHITHDFEIWHVDSTYANLSVFFDNESLDNQEILATDRLKIRPVLTNNEGRNIEKVDLVFAVDGEEQVWDPGPWDNDPDDGLIDQLYEGNNLVYILDVPVPAVWKNKIISATIVSAEGWKVRSCRDDREITVLYLEQSSPYTMNHHAYSFENPSSEITTAWLKAQDDNILKYIPGASLASTFGNCFGMAGSSNNYFLTGYNGIVYDLNLTDPEVADEIIEYQLSQIASSGSDGFCIPRNWQPLNEAFTDLTAAIEGQRTVVLGIESAEEFLGVLPYAHAISAYKTIIDHESERQFIFVYDSNEPYPLFPGLDNIMTVDLTGEMSYEYRDYSKMQVCENVQKMGVDEIMDGLWDMIRDIPGDLWDSGKRLVGFGCPVQPLIINGAGNRFGYIDDTTWVAEIPSSECSVMPLNDTESSYAFTLPADGSYHVILSSYDSGQLSIYSLFPKSGSEGVFSLFEDIELTTQTICSLEIITGDETIDSVFVDSDGNAVYDQVGYPVTNLPPGSFGLIAPEAGASEYDQVEFVWHSAVDLDWGDAVSYHLIISDDSLFTDSLVFDCGNDTTFTTSSISTDVTLFWKITAHDLHGHVQSSRHINRFILTSYVCGDANSDQTVNVGDAVYLIAYVFTGGPPPSPEEAGDANCDGQVNVGDAVYLIAYVFSGGAEPCCP